MNTYEKKEISCQPVGGGAYVIETYYLDRTDFAACYLVEDNGEVAVIETNTNYAVPLILGSLEQLGFKKKQVKYVIVTHIHLDHAGGSGELMRQLPDAQLVVHPRGRKHMINPEKLIESVKQVYGEEQYKELYGEILPIPKERVHMANDGDVLPLGNREFQFFDTPGHAKHHFIIHDKESGAVFSGDNFGIGYPRMKFGESRFIFPSTSPTQFEPDRALETYQKIVDLKPSRVLLTHYAAIEAEEVDAVHRQLKGWIEFSAGIAEKRWTQGLRDRELTDALKADLWHRYTETIVSARGAGPTDDEKEWLSIDTELNAQGMAFYIEKAKEAQAKETA